jgi:hypothetical protein
MKLIRREAPNTWKNEISETPMTPARKIFQQI